MTIDEFKNSAIGQKMLEVGFEYMKENKELDWNVIFNEAQFRLHSKMMEFKNNEHDYNLLMKKVYLNSVSVFFNN